MRTRRVQGTRHHEIQDHEMWKTVIVVASDIRNTATVREDRRTAEDPAPHNSTYSGRMTYAYT